MSSTRLLPMGPRAVLVETDGDPASVAQRVRAGVTGVVDVVPAARTVLVTTDGPLDRSQREEILDAAAGTAADEGRSGAVAPVEIPVRYDGDDLADVAQRIGARPAAVVGLHTAPTYRVAFCGFAPGFAYLSGLDPALHLPRRATPRPRVPAGSVAIASGFSAVYPTASPGGWHLLGRTDATVWDVDRDPPALLAPGTLVRFVAVGPP